MKEKVTAIVLSTLNYKDSDKIFVLFTKEKGIITAIAKNLRKNNSKRSYSLDTLNLVKLQLSYNNNYYFVIDVFLIDNFSLIKKSLVFLSYTLIMLESVNNIVPYNQPNINVYNLLLQSLKQINKNPKKRYIYNFLVHLLIDSGYWDTEYFNKIPKLKNMLNNKVLQILPNEQLEIDQFLINVIESVGEKKLKSKLLINTN